MASWCLNSALDLLSRVFPPKALSTTVKNTITIRTRKECYAGSRHGVMTSTTVLMFRDAQASFSEENVAEACRESELSFVICIQGVNFNS